MRETPFSVDELDDRLVRDIIRRDEASGLALQHLISRYHPRLETFARVGHSLTAEEAQEICESVYGEIWNKAAELAVTSGSVDLWIFRAARYQIGVLRKDSTLQKELELRRSLA